jgi:hypothetical protein
MSGQRRGGLISVQANGTIYNAKGAFTYNLGQPKRDPVVGSDGVHGYTEKPQIAFIEGAITDREDLDLAALLTMTDATVTLQLAVGKIVILRNAWYASEGTGNTEEGEIPFRFEGKSGEETVV